MFPIPYVTSKYFENVTGRVSSQGPLNKRSTYVCVYMYCRYLCMCMTLICNRQQTTYELFVGCSVMLGELLMVFFGVMRRRLPAEQELKSINAILKIKH